MMPQIRPGAIPQRAVPTCGAELVLVGRNRAPSVRERKKPVSIQALVAHTAIEALHERVLIRLAWLNVVQGHAIVRRPDRERPTNELWPVVTDDPTGSAARQRVTHEVH